MIRIKIMEFDKNVNYLTDAFWQIVISAGPVLLVALAIGLTVGIIRRNIDQ